MTEDNVFIQNYIVLSFNSGAWTTNLSNRDVRGEVSYIPRHHSKVLSAESGYSHSQWRPQAEYFEFELRYDTPNSRNRFEKIRELISTNYTLSATINNFAGPFADFTLDPDSISDGASRSFAATFSSAVIEIPEDAGIDKIKRGRGVVANESIRLRIYRSVSLPVPASNCDQVRASDFDVTWVTSGSNNEILDGVMISAGGGFVTSADNASGTDPEMTDTGGTFTETWTWDGGSSRFETTAPGAFTMGNNITYVFSVTLPIVLSDGTNCSYDLETSYTHTGGDTMPTATSLSLTGTLQDGQTLTFAYTFNDVDLDAEGDSNISWFSYSTYTDEKTYSGEQLIKNGTPATPGILSYTLTSAEVGKYIVCKVLPISSTGSNPVGNQAVVISGSTVIA